ncbi:cation acetate symporter [Promicromonospora thailandica]|uniref:Cation/acetate symporter n=1 Tax=Promicromonospora thailandica TaxID=765201 RepID=A0A9X2G0C2_9MICO|nr:cation acetate symporter [Promicromonospora thailandica]MCP2262917.1 cation/acetate symporter [Promicromonospora thailandica]BFF18266.1 cation acetate symporter [Promicromonospora thailandica]
MTAAGAGTLAVLLALVTLVTLVMRPRGSSTVDFYLAGQRVGVASNALAICGDYFSAASFLGVAAAVYVSGLDGVWYAVGFAAGFVPVLLFVAAPLRRFGEFSIPDFLGRRLASERVRLVAVGVVQIVILSYLIPQAVGSGITWQLLVGRGLPGLSAYATGVVLSTAVVAGLVAFGGMRGTTWTQAIQFLLLLGALVWLALAVAGSGFHYSSAVAELSAEPLANPAQGDDGWYLRPEANQIDPGTPALFGQPGAAYGPLAQFALILTLVLGTAGLPHVMNRYFTSPTGTAARMTTVWVIGLAGLFYALAVMLGTAARQQIAAAVDDHPWLDELTVDGVLRVPEHALPVLGRIYGGDSGLAVVAAGALVAVMSTIAGLLLAAAASWGHDVYERHINPRASESQAVWAGRVSTAFVAVAAGVLAIAMEPRELTPAVPSIVAAMVTWAFAIAGSALTPVFVLAIWWRGTTAAGATAGMAVGGTVSVSMFVLGALPVGPGLGETLMTPTLVAAPLAALVTWLVSRRTAPPDDVERQWLVLHGTAADRHAERLARLTLASLEPTRRRSGRAARRREGRGANG